MARYTGSITKQSRREGVQLTAQRKVNKALEKRNYPPGQHTRRTRPSDFGGQLREKQKVKRIYGVLEKQFKNYFREATRSKGVTGQRLLELLETRLDNVVYRAGWALTRAQARQFVNHGHIQVNGRKVDIPSYSVQIGDKLTLTSHGVKSKSLQIIVGEGRKAPSWIVKPNEKKAEAEVQRMPAREEIDAFINEQLIVEYYSR
jgi:small subunit ribosomal protein S4